MYEYMYIYIYIYSYICLVLPAGPPGPMPGSTKRATSVQHATSAPAENGGGMHNVSRNRARTQVPLQARKLHVYGSGAFGAFWQGTRTNEWLAVGPLRARRVRMAWCDDVPRPCRNHGFRPTPTDSDPSAFGPRASL